MRALTWTYMLRNNQLRLAEAAHKYRTSFIPLLVFLIVAGAGVFYAGRAGDAIMHSALSVIIGLAVVLAAVCSLFSYLLLIF